MHSGDSMLPPTPPTASGDTLREGVARLLRGWSLEATHPKAAELDALRGVLPAGTRIYLSAPPRVAPERLVEGVRRVAAAGFEPVPHLAVRSFPSRAALAEFLAAVRTAGAVHRVLAIGGDANAPAGPFAATLRLIESGLLQAAGIVAVDLAGYPEGHPRIPHDELRKALRAKVFAARSGGLAPEVVTQFSFDAKALLAWLLQLRRDFPALPVHVGLAGPANAATLLRFALRCGVHATARGLGRGLSLLGNVSGERTPARLVRALAEGWVLQQREGVSLHFYAFGGVARTAAWVQAVASGAVDLGAERR